MKILVYHPTGNQNVRATINGFQRRGFLESFHTTISVFEDSWYYKYLKGKLSILKKRTYNSAIKPYTHQYPLKEIMMFSGIKKFFSQVYTYDSINLDCTKKVCKYIKKHHKEIDYVYCYPGYSYMIMQEAKKYGIQCVYELTTAYYKDVLRIIDLEKSSHVAYANTITMFQSENFDYSKCDEELNLADYIVCASSYIFSTLCNNGYSRDKIKIIPYGFPPVSYLSTTIEKPIKVLYVGNLSQTKGLSYMLDAVDKMGTSIDFTVIGSIPNNAMNVRERISKYHYLGNLSHDDVLTHMRNSDVLLFPTLTDGFGMVVTESMSQGTPVITTPNSCGKDIIQTNYDGWIVPIQNSQAIVEILNNIVLNPSLLSCVSKNAIEKAKCRSWEVYEDELCDFFNSICSK